MKKITILMSLFLIALSSCSKPRPTLSDDDRRDDRYDNRRNDRYDERRDRGDDNRDNSDDDRYYDRDDDDDGHRHWWN